MPLSHGWGKQTYMWRQLILLFWQKDKQNKTHHLLNIQIFWFYGYINWLHLSIFIFTLAQIIIDQKRKKTYNIRWIIFFSIIGYSLPFLDIVWVEILTANADWLRAFSNLKIRHYSLFLSVFARCCKGQTDPEYHSESFILSQQF